jgi:hypothetical protein
MTDDTTRLSVRQAYEAMLVFLKGEADLTESEELDELLSQYRLMPDGGTHDPAAWEAWQKAVEQVLGGFRTADYR